MISGIISLLPKSGWIVIAVHSCCFRGCFFNPLSRDGYQTVNMQGLPAIFSTGPWILTTDGFSPSPDPWTDILTWVWNSLRSLALVQKQFSSRQRLKEFFVWGKALFLNHHLPGTLLKLQELLPFAWAFCAPFGNTPSDYSGGWLFNRRQHKCCRIPEKDRASSVKSIPSFLSFKIIAPSGISLLESLPVRIRYFTVLYRNCAFYAS